MVNTDKMKVEPIPFPELRNIVLSGVCKLKDEIYVIAGGKDL